MTTVVVPFRAGGKSRLPEGLRADAALAMLGDVLEVVASFGPGVVVTDDPTGGEVAAELGARVVGDPGRGLGVGVDVALASLDGVCLVVNADCPCVQLRDLAVLAAVAEGGALGLVEARDGTTNALALPRPELFAPLYGPGSAARFRAHAERRGIGVATLAVERLVADVDTLADLDGIGPRAGPRTRALLAAMLQ